MSDLVVIVPSRGRPHTVTEMSKAFQETCGAYGGGDFTKLVFAVDADDRDAPEYAFAAEQRCHWTTTKVFTQPGGSMVEALNNAALSIATTPRKPFAVAFMGDDHRPRTKGWDQLYLDALRDLGTGIVYGNDLYQRERIPTQCAMTSDIIATLGYMAPPTLTHMYVDNSWLALGAFIGAITYLPDVVIEHMHPVAGKAQWDEGYRRVNDALMYARDKAAYDRWLAQSLPAEAARIKAVMAR